MHFLVVLEKVLKAIERNQPIRDSKDHERAYVPHGKKIYVEQGKEARPLSSKEGPQGCNLLQLPRQRSLCQGW